MGIAFRRMKMSLGCLVLAVFGLANGPVMAVDSVAIGIVQYNVKRGQGGWEEKGSLKKEVALIVDKVKDPSNPVPVQFVSLVQAADFPISDYLAMGWKTVRGGCHGPASSGKKYVEGVQIGFSPAWELVQNKDNPLSDSFNADNCFSPGRPYDLAYFQQSANAHVKVLVVVIHPGHCYKYGQTGDLAELEICIKRKHGLLESFSNFDAQVRQATGSASNTDLKDLNVLIVGDTNELGFPGRHPACPSYKGEAAGYEMVFPNFGPLQVATLHNEICSTVPTDLNGTCCSNSSWQYFFDRIIVNHAVVAPQETIIKTMSYPLFGGSEEHKAIYAVATFPAAK